MTISNWIELVVLVISIAVAIIIVRTSNQKVKDIDGLGEVNEQSEEDGSVVAHF